MNLISKKELLEQTGISYGQLYRWKREKLIPEEWFIKKSSYTGQETFFPREQILSRIETIKNSKGKYSLEEIAKVLSPEKTEVTLSAEKLNAIKEVDNDVCKLALECTEKEEVSLLEAAFLCVISSAAVSCHFTAVQTALLLTRCLPVVRGLEQADVTFFLFTSGGSQYHGVFSEATAPLLFDKDINVIGSYILSTYLNLIKTNYNHLLQ